MTQRERLNMEEKYCTRKRAYTKSKARTMAVRCTKKTNELITAYKCRWKRHWHIGHAKVKEQK